MATYLAYLILITIVEIFVGIYFLAKKDEILGKVETYFSVKGIQNYFEDIDMKVCFNISFAIELMDNS